MKHPILEGSGRKNYVLVIILVGGCHLLLFKFYFEFDFLVALIDSLIHNLLFGALALGIWYIVRFVGNDQKDFISLISAHVFAALIILLFWSAQSEFLLKIFFSSRNDYLKFLENTVVWRFVIGTMYYLMATLAFYLIRYYMHLQEKLVMELELKSLLNESELKMLKSQINPHFMFNSLNSISSLTISKPEKAQEMVIKLSDFLRYSIGQDSREMNSLREEIENAQLYMEIEKVRFGDKLIFVNEVTEEYLKIKIPNLILQPLFENAIKYGVYESTETVTVKLSSQEVDNLLHISIHNNFDPESIPTSGEGIGLENIRKRLLLVYGRKDLLQVEKKKDTFKVTLKIPTETNSNG